MALDGDRCRLSAMSDEHPDGVAAPCVQCGRAAAVGVEVANGQGVNLCFEHWQQHRALHLQEMQVLQDMADRAEDDMNDIVGLPRTVRPPRIVAPRVNVHRINIHGDNLGVVSTGTVGSIANNLTIINGQDAALAAQLKGLTEAIFASGTLNNAQKQEAADLLNEVAEDAAKPPEQRRSRVVMKTIATGLGQVLGHAADLYTLWTAIEPHLK